MYAGGGSNKMHTWSGGGVTKVSPLFGGVVKKVFGYRTWILPPPPYINNEHSLKPIQTCDDGKLNIYCLHKNHAYQLIIKLDHFSFLNPDYI